MDSAVRIIITVVVVVVVVVVTCTQSSIKHELEVRASDQVAIQSVLIVNELDYEMRIQVKIMSGSFHKVV